MTQKIIKVGNSLALTLPAAFVREFGYKAGDEVNVEVDVRSGTIYITPKDYPHSPNLTPEFFAHLASFTKKNKKLLAELAK